MTKFEDSSPIHVRCLTPSWPHVIEKTRYDQTRTTDSSLIPLRWLSASDSHTHTQIYTHIYICTQLYVYIYFLMYIYLRREGTKVSLVKKILRWLWGVNWRAHSKCCREWGSRRQKWKVAVKADTTGSHSQVGGWGPPFPSLKGRFQEKKGTL